MSTNFYFDKYENQAEQELVADLIEEAIQIYGEDVTYVVRTFQNYDKLYAADDQSLYRDTYDCEMYIKSVSGFGGMKDYLNQFGGNIQDQVEFTVSMRAFEQNVSSQIGTYVDPKSGEEIEFTRPREGDLIYFPLNKKCFMIKFVENKEMFYQLGALYTYDLTCELFKYSGEKFETGIPEIDNIYTLSTNIVDTAIRTDAGDILTTDDGDSIMDAFRIEDINSDAQNDFFQEQANTFVDFSNIDVFAEDKEH